MGWDVYITLDTPLLVSLYKLSSALVLEFVSLPPSQVYTPLFRSLPVPVVYPLVEPDRRINTRKKKKWNETYPVKDVLY